MLCHHSNPDFGLAHHDATVPSATASNHNPCAQYSARHNQNSALLGGNVTITPLGFDVPDWLTLFGTNAQVCPRPYSQLPGPSDMLLQSHAQPVQAPELYVRETARVSSDTICNTLGPLYRGVGPTYVAIRLRFRSRFAQNG